MSAALTRAERETVIVWSEVDEDVRITSTSPAQTARLRADDRFREVPSRYADGLTAEFVIPVGEFNLTKAAKRRLSQRELDQRKGNLRAIHGAA